MRDETDIERARESEVYFPRTPEPKPSPMPTREIVIWTPTRIARSLALAIVRPLVVPLRRRDLPKA